MSLQASKECHSRIFAREEHEHYVEPPWCSVRLFQVETFPGKIVDDPCCGFGTIPESASVAGLMATCCDIVDRGYGMSRPAEDFLNSNRLSPNIVCNPPFAIAAQFTERALWRSVHKVAIIFPTARLNAAHWLRSKPLRRVWLLSPRPSMPPGHIIAAGQKPGGGKMDFCWLVFEHGFKGQPELHWLSRDGEPA